MKITADSMVTMEYTLKSDGGEVIDQSPEGQPLSFIYGSGQIIPGLEKELDGLESGVAKTVVVEAKDGYGESRDDLYKEIPRDNFPEDVQLEEGSVFDAHTPHGQVVFKVHEIREDVIIADFNHPLAGERLHFDIKLVDVRAATDEEIDALNSQGGCCGSHDHSDADAGCGGCGGHC